MDRCTGPNQQVVDGAQVIEADPLDGDLEHGRSAAADQRQQHVRGAGSSQHVPQRLTGGQTALIGQRMPSHDLDQSR